MKRSFVLFLIFYFSGVVTTTRDPLDLTLVLDYTDGNATCIVGHNALDSAVFIENEKGVLSSSSKYIPSDYIFNKVKWESLATNWRQKSSKYQKVAPITDERWEEFQIFRDKRIWPFLKFKSLSLSVYNSSIQRILFRIKFPDDYFVDIYSHYCVLSQKNNIRQRLKLENTNQKWISFTILRDISAISVISSFENNEKIVFNATDFDNKSLQLCSSTQEKNVTCNYKVQLYEFLYSDKKDGVLIIPSIKFGGQFCLAMFIALCDTCSMNITAKINDKEVISLIVTAPKNQNGLYLWKKIVLKNKDETKIYATGEVVLYVEKINNKENGFWGLDKVRPCVLSEIRVITVKADPKSNLTCRSLTNPTLGIGTSLKNSASNSNCGSLQLGNFCNISCISIFNSESYCGNKLCTNAGCTCSYGYEGKDCNDACSNKWGKNCKNLCGKCRDNQECDRLTGECKNGCEKSFIGPTCQDQFHVLTVIEITHTEIKINISKSYGLHNISPKEILLQYRLDDKIKHKWINSFLIYFPEQNPVTITRLLPNTSYEIRALFNTDKGYSYNEDGVLRVHTKALCQEYTEHNLEVRPEAFAATVTFLDTSASLCKWEKYYEMYVTTNNSTPLQITQFTKVDTIPFTDYKIKVINKFTNYSFKKYFKSKPIALSKVVITKTRLTSNSAMLKWEPPTRYEGSVFYIVKYKHRLLTFGTNKNSSEDIEVQLKVQDNFICLPNLKPFIYSNVEIRAYNEVSEIVTDIPLVLNYSLVKPSESDQGIHKEISAKIGDQITLTCPVIGNPTPEITWKKDGTGIDGSQSKHTIKPDQSLQITMLQVTDSGIYTCIADNKFTTPMTIHIKLDVFLNPTSIEQKYPLLSKIELPCASRFLNSHVQWYKNNTSIKPTKTIEISDNGILTIVEAGKDDSGNYRCEAQNAYYKATNNLQVLVGD